MVVKTATANFVSTAENDCHSYVQIRIAVCVPSFHSVTRFSAVRLVHTQPQYWCLIPVLSQSSGYHFMHRLGVKALQPDYEAASAQSAEYTNTLEFWIMYLQPSWGLRRPMCCFIISSTVFLPLSVLSYLCVSLPPFPFLTRTFVYTLLPHPPSNRGSDQFAILPSLWPCQPLLPRH